MASCGVRAIGRLPHVGKYNGPALSLQVLYLQNEPGQLWVEAMCIQITSVLNNYRIRHYWSLTKNGNNYLHSIQYYQSSVVDLIYLGG